MNTPIQITLYDPKTNEEKKTYVQSFVPWKLLKKAASLQDQIDFDNIKPEDMDTVAMLVVETFGGRFSLKDLDNGADINEMIAVIQNIVARANGISLNPIPPVS